MLRSVLLFLSLFEGRSEGEEERFEIFVESRRHFITERVKVNCGSLSGRNRLARAHFRDGRDSHAGARGPPRLRTEESKGTPRADVRIEPAMATAISRA